MNTAGTPTATLTGGEPESAPAAAPIVTSPWLSVVHSTASAANAPPPIAPTSTMSVSMFERTSSAAKPPPRIRSVAPGCDLSCTPAHSARAPPRGMARRAMRPNIATWREKCVSFPRDTFLLSVKPRPPRRGLLHARATQSRTTYAAHRTTNRTHKPREVFVHGRSRQAYHQVYRLVAKTTSRTSSARAAEHRPSRSLLPTTLAASTSWRRSSSSLDNE